MLDAYGANPVKGKLRRVTETGGIIIEDARGIVYFSPSADRLIFRDLFTRIVPGAWFTGD